MIPSDWLGVAFFLVIVAPGLLFDLLAGRRRARPTESAFREASRIVLASVVFSGFALSVLTLVHVFRPGLLPDPGEAITGGSAYVAANYETVVAALVAQLALALGAAAATHWVLARRIRARISSLSAWTQAFRHDCPEGARPHVRVRLADGTVYTGAVAHFSPDLDLEQRELVLAPPLWSKTKDKSLTPVPEQYQRMILRGSAIESMSVEYKHAPTA
jgi:cytochrome c biogenesis factor